MRSVLRPFTQNAKLFIPYLHVRLYMHERFSTHELTPEENKPPDRHKTGFVFVFVF